MARIIRIGDLDITCVSDGILKSSLDFVLGMEREEARRVSGAGEDGVLAIPVNNFVFRRGDATVVIDAGAGNTMQPTLGRLPQNLRAAGYDPAAITHVVLTHLHPDHANGLVDDDQRAIFANAELVVHETEFDFWMRENDGSETEALQRTRARNKINVAPYRDRVRRMRDGETFLGCTPVLAAGHSPGHTCWYIETGRGPLVAWGDLVHFSAIQIPHPAVAVKYDLDADRARQSRMKMLDLIAAQRLPVAGAHVTEPGIGYVEKTATGFAFRPAS
ncbi:MAG TPA: MBL fold metallo-hydrolase [Xanthobacteraceae bacterium]|jgi:glyoxylase-like metal-dependent hydrolase (beta-lactamase superfamily II)|nr:MBL fold metallo-hydrolase [Xanthobacteraceae bacterium]